MTLKNKLLSVKLLVGQITLGLAVTALAAQEIQGEFLTVQSDNFGGYNFTFSDRDHLTDEIRKQIKSKAIKACDGRDYSIDSPSFRTDSRPFGNRDVPPYFAMSGTARVFCMN